MNILVYTIRALVMDSESHVLNRQKIITGTLETITKRVRDQKITRTAIIIIGDVIKPKSYEYSRLYDKTYTHMFRKAKTKPKA